MRNVPDKTNGVDTLSAPELNDIKNEEQNFITSAGIALTSADVTQIAKSVAVYAAGSDFYTDSGAANTYVLTAVGSKHTPPAYFVGMRVRFQPDNANTGASTVNVAGLGVKTIRRLNAACAANDIVTSRFIELVYDGTYFQIADVGDLGAVLDQSPDASGGRLSPTPSLGITDVSGTTVYYLPHVSNKIALFNGSSWNIYYFSSVSLAVPATTDTNYDVFIYALAGVPTMVLTAWTNNTTRASALAREGGILVKDSDHTQRYIGTVRTNGTASTVPDTKAERFCFNYYNKRTKYAEATMPTASWTYATATIRSVNANSTYGEGRVGIVDGIGEDSMYVIHTSTYSSPDVGTRVDIGYGINSTTAFSGVSRVYNSNASVTQETLRCSDVLQSPNAGFYYIQALESSDGTSATLAFKGNSRLNQALSVTIRG